MMAKVRAIFSCSAAALLYVMGSNALAQDAMFVDSSGNVGIGTNTPTKQFHIRGSDTSPLASNNVLIRIENTASTEESRRMLELVNSGSPLLVYRNTISGETWSQNPVGGLFTISKSGTGQQEFQMDGGGNVTIQGALTENSRRSSKEGFATVNPDDVLAKLQVLPISEWSYKHTPSVRHLGPMAEDFSQAFGLGPSDGIAPRDLAGVALSVGQALATKTRTLEEQVEQLKDENQRLRQRLDQLESELKDVLAKK